MTLWTLYDGKIYIKQNENLNPGQLDAWLRGFKKIMTRKNFPRRIQFWTRSNCDRLTYKEFGGFRYDLEYPHMFFDNQPGFSSNLVFPDFYVYANYVG